LRLADLLHGQERLVLSSLFQVGRPHVPFDDFIADTVEADIVDSGEF